MKSRIALIPTVLILSVFLFGQSVFAQLTPTSYTTSLNSITLQVTYPSEVLPGDTVTVNVQVVPRSSVSVQVLTATIYYADAAGLHQVSTQNLVSSSGYGYGYSMYTSAATFSKSFTIVVPQNAPRTSLVAVFSETVQSIYYSYYSSYYPQFYQMGMKHYHIYYYASYPSYSYNTSTDQAIVPLSYIKASTPEYLAVESGFQTLQQQVNETLSQNQQLKATVSQQDATINQLNQQLVSANSATQTYQTLALGLAIVAISLAVFSIYQWRNKEKVRIE